ncbi:MAG: glutamine--fructose-6-phosphate aminotransferase, partial [Candidatus Dojkabacteria bacterium]
MCGIFGYSGNKKSKDTIFNGLKRLEYRGYDSWGIAILNEGKIYQYKNIGEIERNEGLTKLHDGTIGIGHTRWATHGGVTTKNAHPHMSSDKKFSLVQNGIVENFDSLKKDLLKKGEKFISQTDTEIIVKLIEKELLKKKILRDAIITVFKQLEGRNTIAVL